MGYGDPDHQHPLTLQKYFEVRDVTCFRCELPVECNSFESFVPHVYGCTDCNHFVHKVCFELPHNKKHPLHPQHPLTLFPSPISLTNCSICHDPCLGGYTYQCQTCPTFTLHLKCFITLHLKEKHKHPLNLLEIDNQFRYDHRDCCCHTCGFPFDDIDSYIFECCTCWFFIHFECAFLPSKVKRHHAHELTFEYNYPKESDLSYCDVCEDKYDEEPIDRSLSYYYCKICDYIAHVHCVTTKTNRATIQFENFVHEHPMIYSRKPRFESARCACKKGFDWCESYYFCSQCDYKLHKSCAEFPRLIKHPHHKDHTLSLGSCTSINTEAELSVCGFCSKKMEDVPILVCIDCNYAEHLSCARWFSHPHYVENLLLRADDDRKFRCDACGELVHGYRMSYSNYDGIQYDLHLECFALPGKIECGSHSHPLFLITPTTQIRPDLSIKFLCKICHTEADPNYWIYCCKQCNYIAHLKCTIGDFLSNVGSSNDLSSLISISPCEKEQFLVTKPDQSRCSKFKCGFPSPLFEYPTFTPIGMFISPKLPLADDSDQQILPSVTDLDEPFVDILHCPKCERPISSQAYSSITDWLHCNLKANIFTVNYQTPLQQEPLTLLDEELVDKLYCPICNQLIFAPTYSCAECQIYFHKSCAELPRKYNDDPQHMFVLVSPSMLTIMSKSKCAMCMDTIQGYAYVCRRCEIVVDVVCAIGSPLLKLENQKHCFFSKRKYITDSDCKACGNPVAKGSVFFRCGAYCCRFNLHFECALLPYTKLHRIHREHGPLVLEPRLNLSVDDYICDVCEKELNPCLWAYRCSDSCGDRATSHVSCIVTSNKRLHFDYSKECSYPDEYQLCSHVNYSETMAVADLVTALANEAPEDGVELLYDKLFFLVAEIEHDYAYFITSRLKEMDQTDVLHCIESPDALKAKIDDVMEIYKIAWAQLDDNDDDDENLRFMRGLILEISSLCDRAWN